MMLLSRFGATFGLVAIACVQRATSSFVFNPTNDDNIPPVPITLPYNEDRPFGLPNLKIMAPFRQGRYSVLGIGTYDGKPSIIKCSRHKDFKREISINEQIDAAKQADPEGGKHFVAMPHSFDITTPPSTPQDNKRFSFQLRPKFLSPPLGQCMVMDYVESLTLSVHLRNIRTRTKKEIAIFNVFYQILE
ncbi:hypothetical protein SYNPS1DRAFT_30897, partial [Syncephalis pseudoplumigaleata]